MATDFLHIVAIIAALFGAYGMGEFFPVTELPVVVGVLMCAYFIVKRFMKGSQSFEIFFYITIIMYVIQTTGGTSSPFFFLTYFLLFAVSLILKPFTSLFLALSMMTIYLFEQPVGNDLIHYLPIFSLPFMTPFAILLGREYQKLASQREEIVNLEEKGAELEDEVAEQTKDAKLFVSIVVKDHLKKIHEGVQNFRSADDVVGIDRMVRRLMTVIDKFEKDEE